jgi:NADH:ubiquinone oxidoreductase subunit H
MAPAFFASPDLIDAVVDAWGQIFFAAAAVISESSFVSTLSDLATQLLSTVFSQFFTAYQSYLEFERGLQATILGALLLLCLKCLFVFLVLVLVRVTTPRFKLETVSKLG